MVVVLFVDLECKLNNTHMYNIYIIILYSYNICLLRCVYREFGSI